MGQKMVPSHPLWGKELTKAIWAIFNIIGSFIDINGILEFLDLNLVILAPRSIIGQIMFIVLFFTLC